MPLPNPPSAPPSDAQLDALRQSADPLADVTLDRLLGPWPELPTEASAADWTVALQPQWQRLDGLNRLLAQWHSNADLAPEAAWTQPTGLDAADLAVLRDYVAAAQALPAWADAAKIERAEQLFFEEGLLSCLLLFCASLPECYVVPDLAEVLHATAQLEQRTEHRIRATAAMIFPVMLRGGLCSPAGAGRAQVLKVRLIHATVRRLLLRGLPQAHADQAVAPLPALAAAKAGSLHAGLFAQGWPAGRLGLPCNQEELGYTLLTFGYVMLRGLHTLGVPHRSADEAAILHTWNVMGHLIGVDPGLMAHSMDAAGALFERLQQRAAARTLQPDPRPPLGRSLMQCMARVIPLPLCKPMPVLLARRLCGRRNAALIGLGPELRVAWSTRLLFALGLGGARLIDRLARLVWRDFSLARFFGRLLGYRMITGFLLDQTRPLRLPEPSQRALRATVAGWGRDPRAPAWLNRLEDRYTIAGDWRVPGA